MSRAAIGIYSTFKNMTTPDTTHLKASLLEAEEARRLAMLDSNAPKLDMMMNDSMTYVHSSGIKDNKQAYLGLLSSGTVRYETLVFDNLTIQIIGHVGLVSGNMLANVLRGDVRKKVSTSYLAVWANTATGWQLQMVQATSLPAVA